MSVIQMPGSVDVVETVLEAKRRSENCMVDIKNAEKRWHCVINPVITVSGRGILPSYEIIPLDMVPNKLT